MTVTDSAACVARGDLHPGIWPRTARAVAGGGISVGGVPLADIAAGYGTPAYVLDEADVRQRCRGYRQAFPDAEIAYAGKAFLCRAMAHWVDEEGLSLDVCSEGELAVASSVGFPAQRIVLHGNAKTPGDLRAELAYGVGRIVVDSAGEIARIAALAQPAAHPLAQPAAHPLAGPLARPRQRVLVRVTPGVDAHTHPALATGVENQKFGFSLSTGAAADAVRRILAQPELELAGLHCHLGSQIARPEAFEAAARRLVGLMATVHVEHGVTLPELNLGGGHGVPYTEDDQDFDLTAFAGRIHAAVRGACASLRLQVPRLTVEPGRAIHQPGDGHGVPGDQRQALGRPAHLRRRRRRDERQPAAGPVRRPLLGALGDPACGPGTVGHRGRPALRSRGCPGRGYGAARGNAAGRPARGGLHRGL